MKKVGIDRGVLICGRVRRRGLACRYGVGEVDEWETAISDKLGLGFRFSFPFPFLFLSFLLTVSLNRGTNFICSDLHTVNSLLID